MRARGFLLALVAVALILSIAWSGSLYWGTLSARDSRAEVFLTRFDKTVTAGEEACFTAVIQSSYARKKIEPFYAIVNEKVVGERKIDLSQPQEIEQCFLAEALSAGDNFVEIHAGWHKLFYHVSLSDEKIEASEPSVLIEFVGNGLLNVKVEGNDNLEYAPLEIYVNDELAQRVYFSGAGFESNEKIALEEGENKIRVEFKGVVATTTAEEEKGLAMNPVAGVVLVSALLCVLAFLAFAKQPVLEKIAYSILSLFALLMALFFALELLGLLNPVTISIAVGLVTAIIAVFFRSNLGENPQFEKARLYEKVRNVSPLLLLIIGMLLFSSFAFNLFTTSYYSGWTVFYERQSRTITGLEEVPFTDEFSFLGTKPFGYMSGYFFVNSGISMLTGLATQQSYAIIMLLAQAAFLASVLLFFRSFGFEKKRSYLALLAFFLGGFVFSDFSFNVRHAISYAFLFASLFFVRKEKPLHAGIALGLGTFVQTPVFLMFAVALPIVLTKRETVKTAVKGIIVGGLVSLLLFAPTLLRYGIPTQAKYNVWGYMWGIPLYGFFLDYLPLVALVALFIAPFVLKKETMFDRFSLRVAAFLVLFILIQLFVSYRINVVATIAFALFAGLMFPKRFLENKLSEYSLGVLFAVTFCLMFLIITSFYPVVPSAQTAFGFVKQNTSREANFLNEPTLGHSFIFLAERKCTADLAVEYANGEMIEDSFEFIKNEDSAILEKYGIDYVVNRSMFLDEKPVGDNLWHELLEFEEIDKIYDNGLFFVHRVEGRD